MQTDKIGWNGRSTGQAGDRQCRGIGGHNRPLRQMRQGLFGDVLLNLAIFEDRLDHQFTASEVLVAVHRLDPL